MQGLQLTSRAHVYTRTTSLCMHLHRSNSTLQNRTRAEEVVAKLVSSCMGTEVGALKVRQCCMWNAWVASAASWHQFAVKLSCIGYWLLAVGCCRRAGMAAKHVSQGNAWQSGAA